MYFQSKKVLVTGGAGFIGINLINKLVSLGANVTATIYKKDPLKKYSDVKYILSDLRNPEDCKKVCKNIDYIFMCAANTSGAKVIAKTPLVHLTPNMLMNINMLDAAFKANVDKFLFISSNTVYPLTDYPVKEHNVNNEFYESYHIVAWMKRFTEIVCDMYANKIEKPMKTVVVRPGNLYGPYDKFDWEKSKVIPALIRRAIERQNPFVVWGDGNDLKDFLYIDDYVSGMIRAMEKLDVFKPINIAYGKAFTVRDVLSEIMNVTDFKNVKIEYDTSKPTMIPKRMIDISLANELLDWSPKVSIREGIQKTVDWYKEIYNDKNPEDLL